MKNTTQHNTTQHNTTQHWCLALLGITAVLVLAACEGEAADTAPTSLTYPTSKIDASEGTAIDDIVPTLVPQDETVEYTVNPPLPAGLELDPKSGTISGTPTELYVATAVYTVTAKGNNAGTASTGITITVGTLSTQIEVNTVAKANPAEDKRYHLAAFTIKADGTSPLGRYKLALSLKASSAPTVQEMNDGDGVYRIVNGIEKKVFISYTLGSGISELIADANYLDKMTKHGDQVGGTAADVDSYLLSPGTEYTLYALKDEGNNVEALYDFTTDSFDKASTFTGEEKHLDTAIFGGEYMIDLNDAVFVFPISFIQKSSGYHTYIISKLGGAPYLSMSFQAGEFVDVSLSVNKSVLLVPSQSIEGGNPTVSMGNATINTWYVHIPMKWVETGETLRYLQRTPFVTITPTLDQ